MAMTGDTIGHLMDKYLKQFPGYSAVFHSFPATQRDHICSTYKADSVCGDYATAILQKTQDLLNEILPTWGWDVKGVKSIHREGLQYCHQILHAAIATIFLHTHG